MNRQTYLRQFLIDDNGNYMNVDEIKKNILDKLRNSVCHFRFKPVKDSNGNLAEDKIYLYDKYDDSSNTNFNIILELKDLVDIARKIESSLEKKNENTINRSR